MSIWSALSEFFVFLWNERQGELFGVGAILFFLLIKNKLGFLADSLYTVFKDNIFYIIFAIIGFVFVTTLDTPFINPVLQFLLGVILMLLPFRKRVYRGSKYVFDEKINPF